MSNETFVLMILKDVSCQKNNCLDVSYCILVGPENEFMGFFCKDHGEMIREILDSNYQFKKENKFTIQSKPKLNKKRSVDPNKPIITKTCPECGHLFKTQFTNKLFCNNKCRFNFWVRNQKKMEP